MALLEIEKQARQVCKQHIKIGRNQRLTIDNAYKIASGKLNIELDKDALAPVHEAYLFLKKHVDSRIPIYGINTNFGDQVRYIDTAVHAKDEQEYEDSIEYRQRHIIRSLSCGLGDIVSPEIVRLCMALRAHCVSQGYSGVHPDLIQGLINLIHANIIPVVRCYGSIGASGDLIPLAMIASVLIGESVDVHYQGEIMSAPEALAMAGLKPYSPKLRDGLALLNGTSFMSAIAAHSMARLMHLFPQMLAAMGMALESLMVISSAYHPDVHERKGHVGEKKINDFFNQFWAGSALLCDLDELRVSNHHHKPVQDYYSIRSIPQGFGPFEENMERARLWIEQEMNSVNDNPIVDAKKEHIHHSANFMGYYITDACDILKMNIAQASGWIHSLLAILVHPRKNHDLPVNLVQDPAKQNGFRSLQLLAAALTVQNRKLAQAHQSFVVPTEGDNQDVNSLGTHAALDFKEAVSNLERLTAILLLASAQALELRGLDKAGHESKRLVKEIRNIIPKIDRCRPMSDELNLLILAMKEDFTIEIPYKNGV